MAGARSKKATRLPAGWKPKELTGKAAQMITDWPQWLIERELAKFRNYWFAKGGKDACKIDWQRTWINWLIAADERRPRNDKFTDDPTSAAIKRILAE
jgi:hypothetical protein